ncbi:phage major capsid protein [Cereibacter sphaeroides]|nr:phage major capsid protein [Cereibacter sphaeroides]
MQHFPTTASACALLAAGQHLSRKDGGDALDLITRKFGEHTDEVIRRIGAFEEKQQDLAARMVEVEQKGARRRGPDTPATWGQQFVHAPGLKSFAEDRSRPGRFRMSVKAVTGAADSGGSLGMAHRDAPALIPRQRLTVRDLLPTVSISSNLVEYARQVARPTAAAAVAESALKPESGLAFELATTPTQVIAHWIPASRQILDDAPQLADIIDTELRYGLQMAEEAQLLNGNGVSPNLSGLIPNAAAFADPLGAADATFIDTLASAILQTALADFPADGIVLHPADWMRMRTLKDADGRYILGPPGQEVEPRLFGLPVATTKAIGLGSFLVGAFRAAATLYDRWEPMVTVATEHDDFFVRNMVAILAEERIALAVKQGAALVSGNFQAATL